VVGDPGRGGGLLPRGAGVREHGPAGDGRVAARRARALDARHAADARALAPDRPAGLGDGPVRAAPAPARAARGRGALRVRARHPLRSRETVGAGAPGTGRPPPSRRARGRGGPPGTRVRAPEDHMTPPRVLVVVPAHNEEQSLPATLAEVRGKVPGVDLLVVDDGSRDGTAGAARAAG